MYELYAVLVHHGHSVNSGHYIAYVKAASGMWHLCDDTRVAQVKMGVDLGFVAVWHCLVLCLSRVFGVRGRRGACGTCVTTHGWHRQEKRCLSSALQQCGIGWCSLSGWKFEVTARRGACGNCATPAAQAAWCRSAGVFLPTQTSPILSLVFLVHRSGMYQVQEQQAYILLDGSDLLACLNRFDPFCPVRFLLAGQRAPGAGAASLHPVLHPSGAKAPARLPGQGAGGAGSGEGGSPGGSSSGQRGGRRREGGEGRRGGGPGVCGEAAARQPGEAGGGATAGATASNSASNRQQARDDQASPFSNDATSEGSDGCGGRERRSDGALHTGGAPAVAASTREEICSGGGGGGSSGSGAGRGAEGEAGSS